MATVYVIKSTRSSRFLRKNQGNWFADAFRWVDSPACATPHEFETTANMTAIGFALEHYEVVPYDSETTPFSHDQKLLAAMDSANISPEEFGERLVDATMPIDFHDPKGMARRASARAWMYGLPYGGEILFTEESLRKEGE